VRRVVEAHGGDEAAFLGDGFMIIFASPADGLRCAIAIQQGLQRHGRDNADRRVRVRIGLHQGEATEPDGTLYGQAVNAASRVMSEAAGGQILVTAAVHDAVEAAAGFSFVDRGLYWLRGFPDRWRLYEVEWGRDDAGGAIGPGQTPFVGREWERADLRRAVEDTRVGHGSLVLVSGEAGVGKTRLVQEIDAEADARGLRVLLGHSTRDEGRSPYLPSTEMIEQGMVTPRSPAILRRALGEAAPEIARIAPALRLVVPEIPAPLDLPPEQARRYLWLSMREFIGRAAEQRPLLLVFEDLHWADESTLLLLLYLAPSLPEMPVMIVGTFRDDEVAPASPLARILNQLVRERLVTRIPLRRLTEEVVASLVPAWAGGGRRPPWCAASTPRARATRSSPRRSACTWPSRGCCSTTRAGSAATWASRTSRSPPASAWSSGSGWPGCPRPPSGPCSRRPRGAGCSSWNWSSGWPAAPAATCSTPSTRPSGRG